MNTRLKIVVGVVLFACAVLLGFGNNHWLAQASGLSQAAIPNLLDEAVAKGDISQEQADLYLAYALTAPEKLPRQYHSVTPWV